MQFIVNNNNIQDYGNLNELYTVYDIPQPSDASEVHSDKESDVSSTSAEVFVPRPSLSRKAKRVYSQGPVRHNKKRSVPFPRWTEVEDVFLHGIVMDTYARRHSLKPFKQDMERTKKCKLAHGETLVWKHVHQRYKVACERFETLTGEHLGERTVRAIQKRWKHGDHSQSEDLEVDEKGCFLNSEPTYKRLQRLWDEIYNVHGVLTCSEQQFLSNQKSLELLFEDIPREE